MPGRIQDSPADKIRLPRLLSDEISKLRRRGFPEPRVTDLTNLLLVADAYAPDAPSAIERVETVIESAISRIWGEKSLAKTIRVAFGMEGATAGKRPGDRYAAAFAIYKINSPSNFTTRVLPDIDDDLGRQLAAFYFAKEVAEKREPEPVSTGDEATPIASSSPELPHVDEPPKSEPEISPPEDPDPLPREKAARSSQGFFVYTDPPIPRRGATGPKRTTNAARLLGGLLLAAVVLGIGAAVFVAVDGKGSADKDNSVPKPGTVVNSQTGAIVADPKPRTAPGDARPTITLLAFCDLSDRSKCGKLGGWQESIPYPQLEPYVAKTGDTIEASFVMWNNVGVNTHSASTVPFVVLHVYDNKAGFSFRRQVNLENTITWVNDEGTTSWFRPPVVPVGHPDDLQSIEVKGSESLQARYISGSTELLNAGAGLITPLPDGIMTHKGIALTSLGASSQCLCAGAEARRVIAFRFKLIDEKQ